MNIAQTPTARPLTTNVFAKPWKSGDVTKRWSGQHLLVALLAVFALAVPLPYAVLAPGPATDTLSKNLITIKGVTTYPTDGSLFLTTVSVSNPESIIHGAYVLQEWVSPNELVMPRDAVYPPTDNAEQIDKRNAEEMRLSQQNATTAALKYLGYQMPYRILVLRVVSDTPADKILKPADELLQIDGQRITSVDQAISLVRGHKPNEVIKFQVKRGSQVLDLETTTTKYNGKTFVGFAPTTVYKYPFDVTIKLDDVGGPSAGLMFALGIIDKLDKESLTQGRKIAGTGTIDDQGRVGAIGGITEKIQGAAKQGATVFLAPYANCADITRRPKSMTIIAVASLTDAVTALQEKDPQNLPVCP